MTHEPTPPPMAPGGDPDGPDGLDVSIGPAERVDIDRGIALDASMFDTDQIDQVDLDVPPPSDVPAPDEWVAVDPPASDPHGRDLPAADPPATDFPSTPGRSMESGDLLARVALLESIREPDVDPGSTVGVDPSGHEVADPLAPDLATTIGDGSSRSDGPSATDDADPDVTDDAGPDVTDDADADVADDPDTARPHKGNTKLLLTVMALLVVSVPVLGGIAFQRLGDSTRGATVSGHASPTDPGYEALVESTPVALVILHDAGGAPTALTLLSLNGPGAQGGAIITLPLDTRTVDNRFGQRTLRAVASNGTPEAIADRVGEQLSISFGEAFALTPDTLAALMAPVGELTFANPTTLTAPDGATFEAGDLTLTPDQVVAYLTATAPDDTATSALERSELVWQTWLTAIHAGKSDPGIVPGEAGAGIGRYLRGLSAGQLAFGVLPVTDAEPIAQQPTQTIDDPLARLMLTNAVPFPIAPARQRLSLRVLNGVGSDAIPQSVMQRLVFGGGQVTILGNNSSFDVGTTTFTYSTKTDEPKVRKLAAALGTGKLVFDPEGEGGPSVTVVLGSDVLKSPPSMLAPDNL